MTATTWTYEGASSSIREWAERAGGAEIEWQTGTGDARLVGWRGADGTLAIETNGDPIWSDSTDGFAEAWESRSL